MANLHKTERKLPWRVRDGGLPSDWFWGRIGGKFSAVKLVWHTQQQRERIHTHTHTLVGKAQICLLFYCVCIKQNKPKNSHVFIALAREF